MKLSSPMLSKELAESMMAATVDTNTVILDLIQELSDAGHLTKQLRKRFAQV